MASQLRKYQIDWKDISYVMVTHFHPDHCGIVQELQSMGVALMISRTQSDFLEAANESMKKFPGFKEIKVEADNIINENDKASFIKNWASQDIFCILRVTRMIPLALLSKGWAFLRVICL
ncbi:MBL fold metallo-hydrolase [Paenibacillus sp. JTLBN-2024]